MQGRYIFDFSAIYQVSLTLYRADFTIVLEEF